MPWLALLLILALASAPLLIELHEPDAANEVEARTVATSVQTWRDYVRLDESHRGLIPPTPRYNADPVLDRPPGVAWLHLLFFTSLERDEATVDQLLHRARLASAVFALLTVAAVFWAGMSIGGLQTAILAALTCASLPVFLCHGRLATPAIPQLGAAVLAVAAALWAARPLKPSPSLIRQALGWTICGLALGTAVLFGGASLVPKVLIPLAVVLAICPRRITYLFALAAACAIGALMALPWALHVHEAEPITWRDWGGSLVPERWANVGLLSAWIGRAIAWTLLALMPWTLWLIGGLIQPFSTSSVGSRRRMLIGWLWFLGTLAMLLALPPARDEAQLLLLVPPGAFLIGQVFRQFADLSAEGRHARFWRLARYPHLVLLTAVSVAAPMILASQFDLVRDGWLAGPITQPMTWMYWTGLSLALVGIVALSFRYAGAHYPARAAACWAVWVVVAWTVVQTPVGRGPLGENPVRNDAEELARLVGDAPVVYVASEPEAGEPSPTLLLYSGLSVPTLTPAQADQLVGEGQAVYALTPGSRPPSEAWRWVHRFEATEQALWHTLQGRGITAPTEDVGVATR